MADAPLEQQVDHHLSVMAEYGIDRAAAMPSHLYPNPNGLEDTRRINDRMAKLRERYADDFPVAFGTVEPSYGEAALPEIDRMMEELELDGVSWHNRWQRAYVDAPIMYDFVERAAEHDAVVVLHTYAESNLEEPWRAFRLVEDFPDVSFILADPFTSNKEAKKVTHWAADLDRDNVVFDTSGAKNIVRKGRAFVDSAGVEKLIFGAGGYTHNDTTSFACPIEQVERAGFTEAEREAVFHGNAERILGL